MSGSSDRFDILSGGLSVEERKVLLSRILAAKQAVDFEEPVFTGEEGGEPASPQTAFAALPFLQRILLKLQCLFRNKPMESLVTERRLLRLRGRVAHSHPGLLDFRTERLTGRLVDEVDKLRAPLASLRESLAAAFKDPKFLAFLADVELEPLPQQLWAETDPEAIYKEPACTEEAEIRTEALFRFEHMVTHISSEDRERVYRDAQAVEALTALASLRIADLKAQLAPGGTPTGFPEAGRKLRPLCDRLASVRFFPSPTAWLALHLHGASAASARLDPGEEKDLAAFLEHARVSAAAVRDFLRRVPLVDIMRLLTKDISYSPKQTAGGERWFALFKDGWENRLQKRFAAYARERRRKSWREEAAAFCGLDRLTPAQYYAPARFGALYAPRYADSLSFLGSFHDAIFVPRLERTLKLFYINGDFYKPENRTAYTDSFDGFFEACRRSSVLDQRLSPDGDLGRTAGAGAAETAAQKTKGSSRSALESADAEARRIVDDAVRYLQQMGRILHGVLYGEVGGEFDTLTNLSTIGGRENSALREGADAAIHYVEKAASLLAEIKDLETA